MFIQQFILNQLNIVPNEQEQFKVRYPMNMEIPKKLFFKMDDLVVWSQTCPKQSPEEQKTI